MKKNKKITTLLIMTGIVVLSGIIAFSYAYFSTFITGNGNNILVVSKEAILTFVDNNDVSLTDIFPGDYIEKTFSVTSNSSDSIQYSIVWEELTNTFTNNDMEISLSCTQYVNYGTGTEAVSGTCNGLESTPILTINDKIKQGILIEPGKTQEYLVRVTFTNKSSSQNYNKGKNFYGKITIEGDTISN